MAATSDLGTVGLFKNGLCQFFPLGFRGSATVPARRRESHVSTGND